MELFSSLLYCISESRARKSQSPPSGRVDIASNPCTGLNALPFTLASFCSELQVLFYGAIPCRALKEIIIAIDFRSPKPQAGEAALSQQFLFRI